MGHELLRRSLNSLAAHGRRSASLTVTTADQSAILFYETVGFRNRRDFTAFVWELG